MLGPVQDVEFAEVALVLDMPVEELTCGTYPQAHTQWFEYQLRLDRTPVACRFRPSAWPVWNHRIQRPLLFWSLEGADTEALDALAAGDAESCRLSAPSPTEEVAQLAVELMRAALQSPGALSTR